MVHENRQFTAFLQQRRSGLFIPLQTLTVPSAKCYFFISPSLVLIAATVYEKTCLQTDRQTDTHTHTPTDYNNPPAHARGLITCVSPFQWRWVTCYCCMLSSPAFVCMTAPCSHGFWQFTPTCTSFNSLVKMFLHLVLYMHAPQLQIGKIMHTRTHTTQKHPFTLHYTRT